MFAIAVVLFASCKRDENPSPEGANGYRITEVINLDSIGGVSNVGKVEYDGNKVSKILFYEDDEMNSKKEFSYEGNEVTVESYEKKKGEWLKVSEEKAIIENGLLVKSIIIGDMIHTYEYDGKKLVSQERTYVYSDFRERYEYKYSGDKLVEVLDSVITFADTSISKEVITYGEDRIEKIEYYVEEAGEFKKTDWVKLYTYSGDKVSSIEKKNDSGLIDFTAYKYDFEGNLIEEENVIDFAGEETKSGTKYKYEKGSGNLGTIVADPAEKVRKLPSPF